MAEGTLSHVVRTVIPCREDCYPMLRQQKGLHSRGSQIRLIWLDRRWGA